jgi:hypothetical protein
MLKAVKDGADGLAEGWSLGLDHLAREGALQMLIAALDAEVGAYLQRHRGVRDDQGHGLVVRNRMAQAMQVTMGSGTVEITAPRGNDRRTDAEGSRQRFTSAILSAVHEAFVKGGRGAADPVPAPYFDRQLPRTLLAALVKRLAC